MVVKRFNVTGVCNPAMHYMVDISSRIDVIIRDYIDPGEYFVINRARQYGKTTTMQRLAKALREQYLVIQLSFEGGEGYFISREHFVRGVCAQLASLLKSSRPDLEKNILIPSDQPDAMDDFNARIESLCIKAGKPVILFIDEVDRATDYPVFVSFLGALRKKYMSRALDDVETTFHSVVLAGVHDIKNLRAKIRDDSKHAYNSPWNIAARFDVDMSFSPIDIATMLTDYEADYETGMDIRMISERIYEYTSGYPFLVSQLCKLVHDRKLSWAITGVDAAARRVLIEKNTLFDDVIKNIREHKGFSNIVERMILEGKTVEHNPYDPSIDMGLMYGIFAQAGSQVRVSNELFNSLLMNYYISISSTSMLARDHAARDTSLYYKNGMLDFDMILERFSVFMHDEYSDCDSAFIEREARRLLIGYIKPIINGVGNYFLEPEIRDRQRIDLLVLYEGKEYIIEIKIWRGESYENRAYDQISRYVKARHAQVGYIVSFCDKLKAPRTSSIFEQGGIEIHEYVVAYKDKR